MAASPGENLLDITLAVLLAAGGLGRRLAKIFCGEERVQQSGQEMAARSHARVGIIAAAAAREVVHERVDDHVAGAGVEGQDRAGRGGFGDDGDVGDAADVQGGAAAAGVAIEQVIAKGDERRALSAGGHVGGAKIADRGDAGERGDDGGLADLQCGGDVCAEEAGRAALMEDGLAVRADQADAAQRDAEFSAGAQGGFGEELTQTEIQLADVAGGDARALGHAQDCGAHGGGEGNRGEIFEACVGGVFGDGRRDADQGDVDAVGGSAGHEAEDEACWPHGHWKMRREPNWEPVS